VLTEPRHFKGSIDTLSDVRMAVKLSLLMKDIVLNQIQVAAAARLGADAVLYLGKYLEQVMTTNLIVRYLMWVNGNQKFTVELLIGSTVRCVYLVKEI